MMRPGIRAGALCLLLAASCASKLPQLESDLESYQRELDDYRSTLRYVE